MFSSYTCNRRSYLWDIVEPREAFCYFLRIVSPNGCLVLPLSVTPFFSFPLLFSSLFSFVLLSSFLEDGNKYVLLCVIQHEAGGLSKSLLTGFLPSSAAASIYLFKTAIRHWVSPEFIGSRNCVPVAFTAESPPVRGQ